MTILYKDALKIKNILIKFYKKKGIKLVPVGSLARKEKEVSDLDFITSKRFGHNHYSSAILYEGKEIKYDIWYIPKRFYTLALLIRSYPAYYIISIRKELEKKGYKLTDKQLLNNLGKDVRVKDFNEITDLAGVKYHPLSDYYEM